MGPNMAELTKVKEFLHSNFTIKDLGKAKYFIGVEIAQTKQGILLSQTKYIIDLLRDTELIVQPSV